MTKFAIFYPSTVSIQDNLCKVSLRCRG